jgi:hypothetical protein
VIQSGGALRSRGGGELVLSEGTEVITRICHSKRLIKAIEETSLSKLDDVLDVPPKRGRRRDSRRCSVATSASLAL